MEDMPALASSNAVLMRYTALENSLVCQPQNVNMAGRVFGGYLSKCATYVYVRRHLTSIIPQIILYRQSSLHHLAVIFPLFLKHLDT
jgi:hypothetical protein